MQNIDALVAQIAARLTARAQTVATAESCTGGMVAAALTDLAGSSGWFGHGVVTYANAAKTDWLGVRPATLAACGAVSRETVLEMAVGIRTRSGADYGLAVSGIAGPGGATPGKPVGTVWFAIAGPAGQEAFVHRFEGDRQAVRRQAVATLLAALAERLGG